jgi:acyl-CoA thioesterase-1
MRILLMFCYFLIFIFCFSCGENPKKNEENNSKEIIDSNTKNKKTTDKKVILFFGTSLTAGMGLDPNEA